MPDRALILTRQSLTLKDSMSLSAQEERCRAYCHERGYAIVGVSREESVRGWRDDREAIATAVAMAERRELDVLIAWDTSRVARSVRILENLLHELETRNARFESVSEPWTTQVFVRQVLSAVAEEQTRTISRNVSSAKAAMARAGRWHGGVPPYGYQAVRLPGAPPVLMPDPDEQPVVLEVYARFIAGESVGQILRDLNARGIRGRRSALWTAKTIWRILQNPVYRGHVAYKGEVVCHDAHPPLVDVATWERAQRVAETRPVLHLRPDRPTHWLAGSIIHSCGRRMYLMTQRHREMTGGWQASYICQGVTQRGYRGDICQEQRPRISDRKAARAVKACLIADLSSIASVEMALERAVVAAGGSDVARQRETLMQRRNVILRRYDRARDAWADGDEPLAWLEAERDRRDAGLADVDAALDALPAMPDPAVYERVAAMLSDVASVITHASDDGLRAAMVALGVAVVSGAGVQVRYRPEVAAFVGAPATYDV